MPSLAQITPIILSAAHAVLLAVIISAWARGKHPGFWLTITAAIGMLSMLAHVEELSATAPAGYPVGPYLGIALMISFGFLTVSYMRQPWHPLWGAVGLIWIGAMAYTRIAYGPETSLGTANWIAGILTGSIDPQAQAAVIGWGICSLVLLGMNFLAYRTAHLPEVANRLLYWLLVVPLMSLGIAMGASGAQPWAAIGWGTQLAGMIGAAHGILAYRVFDIRRALRKAMAFALLTMMTAAVILGGLLVAQALKVPLTGTEGLMALAGIALAVALLYAPLRVLAEWFIRSALRHALEEPTQILRRYTQEIGAIIDMDELVRATMEMMARALRVHRGALLLATPLEDGSIELKPMRGMGEIPEKPVVMKPDSPIYRTFHDEKSILLQYDLEFRRKYSGTTPEEKAFFAGLRMSAYAPIIVQGELIGVLATGPKMSDDPFYPRDLELLATIANQTGVALRNARLVSDLREVNAEMAALNIDLNRANERLARLDAVKSDFITIASHELRTPLAQIRGYTDILEALNEQGMLDQEQIAGMTANLRKAADRLEELISDMLDVSQLDVDAMDLRFTRTTVEAVVRMAVEPLADAIKARKLTLTGRGLRGLPEIEADLKRLVQAFRNVITNAIKYTPDGGRIDIKASVSKYYDDGNPLEIQIAVHDTGVGIDPEYHELIFEKFFRTGDPRLHSTGETKFMGAGPGLGLTIARGVIEGHGGKIWVESPGFDPENFPGSTFYITLPVRPPKEARRVRPLEEHPPREPTHALHN